MQCHARPNLSPTDAPAGDRCLRPALLAGCAEQKGDADASAAAAPGFPVSVDNCGVEVTLQAAHSTRAVRLPPAVGGALMLALPRPARLHRRHGVPGQPAATEVRRRTTAPSRSCPTRTPRSSRSWSWHRISSTAGTAAPSMSRQADRAPSFAAAAGIAHLSQPEYCATEPITMDDVYDEVRTIATAVRRPGTGRLSGVGHGGRVSSTASYPHRGRRPGLGVRLRQWRCHRVHGGSPGHRQ